MRHDYVNVGKKVERRKNPQKRKPMKHAPAFMFACFFIGSFVLADVALNSLI